MSSQVSGVKNIPGDYSSLANAIADVNNQGVGPGGVTINLNQNETAPSGGYLIGSTQLNIGPDKSSMLNPVQINGNNHSIYSFSGNNLYADTYFRIAGADGIILENIILIENSSNITDTTRMERGIWICQFSQNDAPKDVHITNCHISFNASPSVTDIGILVNSRMFNEVSSIMLGSTITPSNSDGILENIRIQACMINNGSIGILVSGGSTTGLPPASNIQIGGPLVADGNTITAFGNYGQLPTSGMEVGGFKDVLIQHNMLNTVFVATTAATILRGIRCGGTGSINILNNDISIQQTIAVGFGATGIECSPADANNVSISGNFIHDFSTIGTGNFYMIWVGNCPVTGCLISNNIITNFSRGNGGGVVWGISVFGGLGQFKLIDNTISNFELYNVSAGIGGYAVVGIHNDAYDCLIRGNVVSNFKVHSYSSSINNNCVGITSIASNAIVVVDSNRIENFKTFSNNVTLYGISAQGFNSSSYIERNVVHGLVDSNLTGFVQFVAGIFLYGYNDTSSVVNNMISKILSVGGNSDDCVQGIRLDNSGLTNTVFNNTIIISPIGTLSSVSSNFGASAISWKTTSNLDLRNNILHCDAIANGNGIVSALRVKTNGVQGTCPVAFLPSSNNNIYYSPNMSNSFLYAEGAGAGPFVNMFNLSNDPSFNSSTSSYKQFSLGRDSNSFSENNLTQTSNNLFIPWFNGYTSNGGQFISTVSDDLLGVVRNIPPDIGAIEFGVLSPLGVMQSSNSEVSIYPNPCRNKLFMDFEISEARNFEFYDLSGRTLRSFQSAEKIVVVNIPSNWKSHVMYRVTESRSMRVFNGKFYVE